MNTPPNTLYELRLEKASIKNDEIRTYIYVDNRELFEIVLFLCSRGTDPRRTQLCLNYEINRDEVVQFPIVTRKIEGYPWFAVSLNFGSFKVKHLCLKKWVNPLTVEKALKSGKNHFNEHFDLVQRSPTPRDFRIMNGKKNTYDRIYDLIHDVLVPLLYNFKPTRPLKPDS